MTNIRKIRKVVFPVSNFETCFLPARQAMPRELLPIVDKALVKSPAEDAVASGIDKLIFLTGCNKPVIQDYFAANN